MGIHVRGGTFKLTKGGIVISDRHLQYLFYGFLFKTEDKGVFKKKKNPKRPVPLWFPQKEAEKRHHTLHGRRAAAMRAARGRLVNGADVGIAKRYIELIMRGEVDFHSLQALKASHRLHKYTGR